LGLLFVQIEETAGRNRRHIHIRNSKCTRMDPVGVESVVVAEIEILFVDFAEIGFEWVVVPEV